jgi:hypothetical protein
MLASLKLLADGMVRLAGDMTGREVVDDILQRVASEGMTTLRVWAHTQASFVPFQILPGQYSERGLKGLDYTIDAARRAGLQVRRPQRSCSRMYSSLLCPLRGQPGSMSTSRALPACTAQAVHAMQSQV